MGASHCPGGIGAAAVHHHQLGAAFPQRTQGTQPLRQRQAFAQHRNDDPQRFHAARARSSASKPASTDATTGALR